MKPKKKTKLVSHLKMVLTKLPKTDAKVRDRLGGSPNQWSEEEPWPVCGYCNEPLHFVLQLRGEGSGGRAKIGKASCLQLFVCHGEGDCEFYELGSKGNHVALRKKPLKAVLAKRPGGDKSSVANDPLRVAHGVTFKEGADDPEALEDYDDEARQTKAHRNGFTDKLYGVPVAANQPDDDLECSKCEGPMAFLGQILSADDWFIYYLHACKKGHEVAFHAQRA